MPVEAYVFVDTLAGKTKEVRQSVTGIPGVKSCHAVTGPHDVIAFIEANNLKRLGEMVVSRIQAVEGVFRTITCVVAE